MLLIFYYYITLFFNKTSLFLFLSFSLSLSLSLFLSLSCLPDVKQVWIRALYARWIIANEKLLERQSFSESALHWPGTGQRPKLLRSIRDAQRNGKFRANSTTSRKLAATTLTYLRAFHGRKRKCKCKESARSSREICGRRCALVSQLTRRNAAILSSTLGNQVEKPGEGRFSVPITRKCSIGTRGFNSHVDSIIEIPVTYLFFIFLENQIELNSVLN